MRAKTHFFHLRHQEVSDQDTLVDRNDCFGQKQYFFLGFEMWINLQVYLVLLLIMVRVYLLGV